MPRDDDTELIRSADVAYAHICAVQRSLFHDLAEISRQELWRQDLHATSMGHWVSMRYGISAWKAHRWVASARALESQLLVAAAFEGAAIGIDAVVELTRLIEVSEEPEEDLLDWAIDRPCGAIRARADQEIRWSQEQTEELERTRDLSWGFYDEGRRFRASLDAPAAQGAVFVKAISRELDEFSTLNGASPCVGARRAYALIALASTRIGADPDPDRATIVVHTSLEGLSSGDGTGVLEGGGVIDPPTLERLGCDARIQLVKEDPKGDVAWMGRVSRVPSQALARQVRYRDRDCRFPRCPHRRFTNIHHIVHWARGGRSVAENLVLICTAHHKAVHEHGWGIKREADGALSWFRPDGRRYRAGPAPPGIGVA
jgi:hypothetical protein